MAVVHGGRAAFSFLSPPALSYSTIHRFRLKPILASYASTPFPSKQKKRINHLRQKILKTLTKPFPTVPLPEIETVETKPFVRITSPPENDVVFDGHSDKIPGEIFPAGDVDKVEEFRVSETISAPAEYGGSVGKISAWSVLKFGGYLVGLYVFAVWVQGYKSSDKQESKWDNLDYNANVLLNGNGNVGYLDETQLAEKINEIRAMARAAREIERRESSTERNEESAIEKEIGARIAKLEKRLNSKRDKLPESFINFFGMFRTAGDELSEGSLDSKENNKTLMFKKKCKFRNPDRSFIPNSNPKGFSGSNNGGGSGRINGDDPKDELKQNNFGRPKTESGREVGSSQSTHNEGNKLEKKRTSFREEAASGAVKETSKKAGISRDLEEKNSQGLTKENQKGTFKFDEPASLSRNDSRDSGKRSGAKNVGDKQSDSEKDLWWLNLPYVLAIHMRRGSEPEGPGGLYALRLTSQADELEDSSYTIAFEDHGDANNFCYLLESYFEDLGDLSADIVPLSIKELREAVTSHSKKVIVVKKGQLKLYAGQPFAEVEIALHSLLQQNQVT